MEALHLPEMGQLQQRKGENNLFKSKEEIAVPVSIELFGQKSSC